MEIINFKFFSFFIHLIFLLKLTPSPANNPIFQQPLQDQPAKNPLLQKAEYFFQLRKFDKSIQYSLEALKKFDEKKETENVIAAKNLLGASYIRVRQYDKALTAINEGLATGKKYFKSDHFLIGESNHNLGVYYDRTGNAEEAIKHHETALNIRVNSFGKDHLKVAESLVGLGEVYLYTVLDFKKASTLFQKSAEIRDLQLESDHFDRYIAYFYVAQVNKRSGDYDKALAYAFKALSVINAKKAYQSYLERCYTLLGDIYYAQTKFEISIQYLKNGISESIKTDGPDNYNLIKKYTNLGVAYGEMKQTSLAIAAFKNSLRIYNLHAHHNAEMQAENYLRMGKMFHKAKKFDSSAYYLNKCLKANLSESGQKHSRSSETYLYLAKVFQDSKHLDSALFYIQKSLMTATGNYKESDSHINPDYEKFSNHANLFQIFADKGSILLDLFISKPDNLNNLIAALECFKIADTLMLLSRNSYQQEGSKLFFADHYHHIYEKALQTSYLLFDKTKDPTYAADAFSFMEKSKAFLLAESLHKAEIFTQAGLPDSIREMERSLNSALVAYRSQLENHNQKPNAEEIQARIQSQIFEISKKQERLLDTIAQLYPNYFQIKYQKISTLSEIQDFAKKNNSTILEYFWGAEKIYLLAISGRSLHLKEATEVDSLTQKILQYFRTLQQMPSWKKDDAAFQTFFANTHSIYNNLIAPLLEDENPDKLVIIRDGPLLLIPFESLPVSKTNAEKNDYQQLDYLLRHHTISYAHSAAILIKNSLRLKTNSEENKVLAFSYSQLNPSQKDLAGNRSANELPGAAREIHAISQILPGLFLEGEDATEQKFKMHAGDFDILHLAVHGRADPEKQFSGSLFFKQSKDKEDDGELHVYELYDMSLKARLTVLSACESGVGKIFRGEGVFSIARAFAYAGCPSTVMTLWPISDLTSADIMRDFYSELKKGKDIDAALRKAKLNYLNNADNKLSHPYYWAAYVPIGNMESVIDPGFRTKFLWALMFITFGVLGFLILWKKNLKNKKKGS